MTTKSVFRYLTIALLLIAKKEAIAAGYSTHSESTSGIATSYAGTAAGAHDISDSFANPANLSNIRSKQVLLSATLLHLNIDTKNNSGFSGSASTKTKIDALVPAFFAALPVNKKINLGLSVTAPFGLTTKYDQNWPGRYHALTTKMQTTNINPFISYQLNNKLSVGAGLQAQYMRLRLTNAMFIGSDIGVETDGNSWGYGYNLGAKYKFNKKLAFGLGYRSEIKHKLQGKVKVGSIVDSNFDATIITPESVDTGLSYQANDKLALLADVSWTRWSRMKYVDILTTHLDFNWRDSFKYSLGANYQVNHKWLARAGAAYETDSTTDGYRNPKIPGGDRIWTSVGTSYKICNNSAIDFAYLHLFYKKAKVNLTSFSSEQHTAVDAFSIAYKYSF
jgi:long-chain fatty acid transport protein